MRLAALLLILVGPLASAPANVVWLSERVPPALQTVAQERVPPTLRVRAPGAVFSQPPHTTPRGWGALLAAVQWPLAAAAALPGLLLARMLPGRRAVAVLGWTAGLMGCGLLALAWTLLGLREGGGGWLLAATSLPLVSGLCGFVVRRMDRGQAEAWSVSLGAGLLAGGLWSPALVLLGPLLPQALALPVGAVLCAVLAAALAVLGRRNR